MCAPHSFAPVLPHVREQEYCDGGSLFDAIFERRFHGGAAAVAAAAAAAAAAEAAAALPAPPSPAVAATTGSAGATPATPATPDGSRISSPRPAEAASAAAAAGGGAKAFKRETALILRLASQIASGCAYIHSKNIIHGDLKVGLLDGCCMAISGV